MIPFQTLLSTGPVILFSIMAVVILFLLFLFFAVIIVYVMIRQVDSKEILSELVKQECMNLV